MYKIKLQKILFLALNISAHYKKTYFNTNDLVKLANRYQADLVRTRTDKKDYRYLDDTKFGGLRGNFSTLLTLQSFVKRGNQIVPFYSLGRDDRIVNAVSNGEIILDSSDFSANTENSRLKDLLESEVWLLNTRENQAHIKVMLKQKSEQLGIKRDNDNFKKDSVVVSTKGQYFIRSLLNNFIRNSNLILEYNLYNYWSGTKISKKNMHPLLVLPSKEDPWDKIYAVKFEDLIERQPMFLRIDLNSKVCTDKYDNIYDIYPLDQALINFSDGNANIESRLSYSWKTLQQRECADETDIQKETQQQETWMFIKKYLQMNACFSIDGKNVLDLSFSSSGGCDVLLKYSGGTTQKLELEHEWKNYLDHKHYENNAWSNAWLFAEQEWDPELILKLFQGLKKTHGSRIPDVFLCLKNGQRKAYKADWDKGTFTEIPVIF